MQSWEMRRAAAREQLEADAEQQEQEEQRRLAARDAKLAVWSCAQQSLCSTPFTGAHPVAAHLGAVYTGSHGQGTDEHEWCLSVIVCAVAMCITAGGLCAQALKEAQEEIHGGSSAGDRLDAREQRKKKRLQAHLRKLAAQRQAQ